MSIWQENGSTEDHIKWYSKKFKKGLLKIGILDKHFHCLRHSFGARRIIETNGNIHQVMREMGHSNTQTTMRYLRFPEQRRLDDFPSLKDYILKHQDIGKNTTRATNLRATVYSNIPKLTGSIRN